MNPWLSVLLPVYNVEPYLSDCLQSISMQDLSGVEIIAVDDCSTDGSFQALKTLASSAKLDLRLLRHDQNRGVSAARNTLVDAATGEYLWFLDPDDIFAKDAIRELRKIVESHDPDLVLCDFKRWRPGVANMASWENHLSSFEGPSGVLLDDGELLFKGLYESGRLHPWSKISKRKLWGASLRFPVGQCFEDAIIMPQVALRARRYFYQNSVWINYRQREGSIIATPSLKKIEDMSTSVSSVMGMWSARYPAMRTASKAAFYGYCVKIHIKVVKNLAKINKLTPDILRLHRNNFRKNTGVSRYEVALCFLLTGNLKSLLKLAKVFRYL